MIKLAIDVGTSVTKIFRVGSGVVFAEPTCVTVQKDTGEIRAYGSDAKRLWGKTAEYTDVVFPMFEGEIVNERCMGAYLEYCLSKTVRRGSVEAVFCVPCAYPAESREKYYRAAKAAGVSRIGFIETPYLAALGQNVALSESNPVFAIDVGAGKTSIAVFSLDGMIAGVTINVGGNNMDVHIIDHIANMHGLKIGALTSEKLKNTVGSLIPNDCQSMIVNGRELTTGNPCAKTVTSQDLTTAIQLYVDKIIEYASLVLQKLPAEVSAAMCKNGVILAGGVCGMVGFADYVAKKLNMDALVSNDPNLAVVLGGGRAIANDALLKKIQM